MCHDCGRNTKPFRHIFLHERRSNGELTGIRSVAVCRDCYMARLDRRERESGQGMAYAEDAARRGR